MEVLTTKNAFDHLCFQRSDIVRAAYEPTDEECEWKQDEEEELTVSKQVQVIHTCMPFKCHHISFLFNDVFGHNLTLSGSLSGGNEGKGQSGGGEERRGKGRP